MRPPGGANGPAQRPFTHVSRRASRGTKRPLRRPATARHAMPSIRDRTRGRGCCLVAAGVALVALAGVLLTVWAWLQVYGLNSPAAVAHRDYLAAIADAARAGIPTAPAA